MSFPTLPPQPHCWGLLFVPKDSNPCETLLFHGCLLSPTKWLPLCRLPRTPRLSTHDGGSWSVRKRGSEKVESKLPPRLGQDPRDACVPPLRTACVQLAKTMWTSSTASKAFHQVRQGLGWEALPVHTPCPGPPCLAAVAWVARKARAAQVEIVRKRQWMSRAPPKNRKPPPSSREPGPEVNSFGKRQRGKRKRWDAKTEVRRFERRKPTWNDTLPLPFGGGRGRGRSRGLSFVSRGEALGGGFTVGSRTGAGIVMTSPARTQMPPARRTRVGRSPADPIAAAAGSDRHAGRGATHLLRG